MESDLYKLRMDNKFILRALIVLLAAEKQRIEQTCNPGDKNTQKATALLTELINQTQEHYEK